MVDTSMKVGKAILWAIIIFLVSAGIESVITMWMFKKFGGCPLRPDIKETKKKVAL